MPGSLAAPGRRGTADEVASPEERRANARGALALVHELLRPGANGEVAPATPSADGTGARVDVYA